MIKSIAFLTSIALLFDFGIAQRCNLATYYKAGQDSPICSKCPFQRCQNRINISKISEQGNFAYSNPSLESLSVTTLTNGPRARITIRDTKSERWEVPTSLFPRGDLALRKQIKNDVSLRVNLQQDPFTFKVQQANQHFSREIFDSSSARYCSVQNPSHSLFSYANRYLQVSTKLPGEKVHIYGLGQRVHEFNLWDQRDGADYQELTWTMWSVAQDNPYDSGHDHDRSRNIYGVHPFYLAVTEDQPKSAHGVFFLSSNAMDVVMNKKANTLSFRAIGGILDIFFFAGPTPNDVIKQYHLTIGPPVLPPQWALGWHQCRWGYWTLQQTMAAYAGYREHNIPLDAIWNDIDYMDQYKDWTLDNERFPHNKFRNFLQQVHSDNAHYIPIVDAGVANRTYKSYIEGEKRHVFIKDRTNTELNFVGKVWPGPAVFVNFFHQNASSYWSDEFKTFHQDIVQFDGVWLDMNEASSFCDGQCYTTPREPKIQSSLPYIPGRHSLEDQLLPLEASHEEKATKLLEYNVHPLYGTMETKATAQFIQNQFKRRPVLISRSTYSGHGAFGGHWLGDNNSTFEMLKYSIAGVLNFQMFGIPLVGADICGFHNDTTSELCIRWHQVGSFYPFSRNHNDNGTRSQEPWAFDKTTLIHIRESIRLKYALNPYIYTLFAEESKGGPGIWRSMLAQFWDQDFTSSQIYSLDTQFMVGSHLLVAPILEQGEVSRNVFIPSSITFYDFFEGTHIQASHPQIIAVNAPLGKVPTFVKQGSIIPLYSTESTMSSNNMADIRKEPFQFLIAIDHSSGQARGQLYLDAGEGLNFGEHNFYQIAFLSNGQPMKELQVEEKVANYEQQKNEYPGLKTLTLYGLDLSANEVILTQAGKSMTIRVKKVKAHQYVLDRVVSMKGGFTLKWKEETEQFD